MSAARAIPPLEETVQPLTFTYANSQLTVSSPGLMIAPGDQVSFANSAASQAAISITFNANPPGPPPGPTMFSNISNLAAGAPAQVQAAPNSAGSVNYYVTVNGVASPFGPYVIQAGNGQMIVQISGTAGNITYNPTYVAIPLGSVVQSGMLEMDSAIVDAYNITWNNGCPVSPAITQTDCQPHPVNAGVASAQDYPYSAAPAPPPPHGPAFGKVGGGGGGGHVIIKST